MGKACLVVDDSRVIRKVARSMLEELGFSVHEAEDGLTALDACRQSMPEAILLDWNMPNLNGIEFLRRLRREEPGGEGPIVVFCTTESDIGRISEALEAGASEFIMKPFDRDILQAKLAEVGLV
ncbi:MAG: response regulator [Alphaproteobacteria bacterium]|nr:response regulator [Alphaproteobacteria bacterium]